MAPVLAFPAAVVRPATERSQPCEVVSLEAARLCRGLVVDRIPVRSGPSRSLRSKALAALRSVFHAEVGAVSEEAVRDGAEPVGVLCDRCRFYSAGDVCAVCEEPR